MANYSALLTLPRQRNFAATSATSAARAPQTGLRRRLQPLPRQLLLGIYQETFGFLDGASPSFLTAAPSASCLCAFLLLLGCAHSVPSRDSARKHREHGVDGSIVICRDNVIQCRSDHNKLLYHCKYGDAEALGSFTALDHERLRQTGQPEDASGRQSGDRGSSQLLALAGDLGFSRLEKLSAWWKCRRSPILSMLNIFLDGFYV